MSLELLPATAWYTVAEFIYKIRFCLFLNSKERIRIYKKAQKIIIVCLMEVLMEEFNAVDTPLSIST